MRLFHGPSGILLPKDTRDRHFWQLHQHRTPHLDVFYTKTCNLQTNFNQTIHRHIVPCSARSLQHRSTGIPRSDSIFSSMFFRKLSKFNVIFEFLLISIKMILPENYCRDKAYLETTSDSFELGGTQMRWKQFFHARRIDRQPGSQGPAETGRTGHRCASAWRIQDIPYCRGTSHPSSQIERIPRAAGQGEADTGFTEPSAEEAGSRLSNLQDTDFQKRSQSQGRNQGLERT